MHQASDLRRTEDAGVLQEIGKQLDFVQRQIQEESWRFSLSLSLVLFLLHC